MPDKPALHEDYRRADPVKAGSNRAFGFVFAAVFAVIGLVPLLGGKDPWGVSLFVAGWFLVLALFAPSVLGPLSRLWHRFGLLLHKIVNPLVMAFLFYATVTPTALAMRLFGKDPLGLRFDKEADTYWIERRPPGPEPETMKNQF